MSARCPYDRKLRYPWFTLSMSALLIVAAIATDTLAAPISSRTLQGWGYAPQDLWTFQWHRLVASALVTSGGFRFWRSLVFLIIFVGLAERGFGTRRAAIALGSLQLLTLLISAFCVTVPLYVMGSRTGVLMATAKDVGSSAGYYGCLGMALVVLPARVRWMMAGSLLLMFVVRLSLALPHIEQSAANVAAEIEHIIALPLGMLWGTMQEKSRVDTSRVNDDSEEAMST